MSAGASHGERTECHKGLLSGQRPESKLFSASPQACVTISKLRAPAYQRCHCHVSDEGRTAQHQETLCSFRTLSSGRSRYSLRIRAEEPKWIPVWKLLCGHPPPQPQVTPAPVLSLCLADLAKAYSTFRPCSFGTIRAQPSQVICHGFRIARSLHRLQRFLVGTWFQAT